MSDSDKEQFFYPHESYRGEFTLENVAFNANLQEFAKKVNVICNLETNGKITTYQAYSDIKALWKQLKSTKKSLDINKPEE
ncbi:MAG: hypothetical protein WBB82_12500 [Limnothrix sp.]